MFATLFATLQGIAFTIGETARAMLTRRSRRFLLLLPVLLMVAMVLALITSSGALAPFVYPLF